MKKVHHSMYIIHLGDTASNEKEESIIVKMLGELTKGGSILSTVACNDSIIYIIKEINKD